MHDIEEWMSCTYQTPQEEELHILITVMADRLPEHMRKTEFIGKTII